MSLTLSSARCENVTYNNMVRYCRIMALLCKSAASHVVGIYLPVLLVGSPRIHNTQIERMI